MTNQKVTSYATLAEIYDEWDKLAGVDYIGAMTSKLEHFLPALFENQVGIDLGCGTGRLSIALAKGGAKIFAVDFSPSMLKVLKKKIKNKKLSIIPKQQDMRKLKINEAVDFVISFGDAMNHLQTEDQLRQTCSAVKKNLKKGGLFIFDLFNDLGYRQVLHKVSISDYPSFTIIYFGNYDPEHRNYIGKFTCFVKNGKSYLKKTDELKQYCFQDEEVKIILQESGFEMLHYETFNPFPHLPLGLYRSLYVARLCNY